MSSSVEDNMKQMKDIIGDTDNTKPRFKSMKDISKSTTNLKETAQEDNVSAVSRNNPESKMEDSLTNEKLLRLEKIFEEADEDGGGGLDMEEFRNAMRQTMGNPDIEDHELDMIFMKVDTNCDGTVDWDEYLTYTLLECREKDIMHVQAQQPFPRQAQVFNSEHRDSVIRLLYQPAQSRKSEEAVVDKHSGRYISVGRDGILTFWNIDMQEIYTRRIEPVLPKSKSVWVTDMCLLPKAGLIAVATTTRVVLFYDISANRFDKLSRITGLEACPTTVYYWSCEHPTASAENFHSVLLWGDDHGGVTVVKFNKCPLLTVLNPKRMAEGKRKGRVHLMEIIKGMVPDVRGTYLTDVHKASVIEVVYEPSLDCFLSCCKDSETSMYMGDLDRRIVSSYFSVHRGINTFDYCKKLAIIVSGGYDTLVRVWNPYVTNKPVILLDGHQSPIVHVCVNSLKEHVVSLAENKEIRVHDLNSQTCIQTFFKKMLPDLGPRIVSACLFNPNRQAFLLATTVVAILEGREEDSHKQLMTHSKPITAALFNPLFNQVVSASWDSMVCVWNFVTGRKEMQFKAHKIQRQCETYDVEITALTFDPTYRRLITAGREGRVRIWNFNNGALLRELERFDRVETTAIICTKQRIFTAGWNKRITIFVDRADDDMVQWLRPSHREDVTSLSSYHGHVLASASYNGDIYLWSVETGGLLFCLNAAQRNGRPLSAGKYLGESLQYPITYRPINGKKCKTSANPKQEQTKRNRSPTTSLTKGQELNTGNGKPYDKDNARRQNRSDKNRESVQKKTQNAVEQVLFLENRDNTKTTATLLTASSDGFVRAWSIHHRGGKLGEFHAGHNKGDGINAIALSPDYNLLVSGDAAGYIKLWDINHYCTGQEERLNCICEEKYSTFPFLSWKKSLKAKGFWETTFPNLTGTDHPHLLTSLRGHVSAITSIQYIHLGSQDFILSGGFDGSVRLWTVQGEFLGIFGASASVWNIKNLKMPVWREGEIQTPISDQGLQRATQVLMPPDVRKVASATTLRILYASKTHSWAKTGFVVKWLLSRKFNKMINSLHQSSNLKSINTAQPDKLPPESSTPQEEKKARSGLNAEPALKERKGHLGKFFKKTMRHQKLPSLVKPIAYQPHCAAYRSLPFHELEKLPNLMKNPVMKEIQVEYRLTPLGAQAVVSNRIGKLYQKTTNLLSNKDSAKRKTLANIADKVMLKQEIEHFKADIASKNRRERKSLLLNMKADSARHLERRVTLMLESARSKGDVPAYTNIRENSALDISTGNSIASGYSDAFLPAIGSSKRGSPWSSLDSVASDDNLSHLKTTPDESANLSQTTGKLMTVIEE